MVIGKPENEIRVRIDLEQFIRNATLAGLRLRNVEAEEFLEEWGFRPLGNGFWSCPPEHLTLLHEDEICEVRSSRIGPVSYQ
jgi:hypothetical protein